MSNIARIDLEPDSVGERSRRYRVHHARGVLIESIRNPEFDSCRLLLAKGIVGQLEACHLDGLFPAMRIDIAKSAGLTVGRSRTMPGRDPGVLSCSSALASSARFLQRTLPSICSR